MGAAKPRGDRALLKTTIIALTVTFRLLTSLASAQRTESEIDQQMRLLKDTNPAVRAKPFAASLPLIHRRLQTRRGRTQGARCVLLLRSPEA